MIDIPMDRGYTGAVKVLTDLAITGVDSRGRGRGLAPDGRAVAVVGALPGDTVDARVTRRRGSLIQATATSFSDASAIPRVTPFCSHFAECGGCTLQDVPYADQLALKASIVRASFREAGVPEAPIAPILPSPEEREYRNKLEYSFGAQRWLSRAEIESGDEIADRRALGFHAPGRFDRVIAVERCHLQPEPGPSLRTFVDTYAREHGLTYYDAKAHTGFLRLLTIRTSLTGQTMVIVMFGERHQANRDALLRAIRQEFPDIDAIAYVENDGANDSMVGLDPVRVFGADYIEERCGPLTLRIRPKAFYQTNPRQAERLYHRVRADAGLTGEELLFDLFSGIGSIGMYLSADARRVVCVESVPEAVAAAEENIRRNTLDNVDVVPGLVERVLPEVLDRFGAPDVMVVDPPRAGLHPAVIPLLKAHGAPRIVYVSCNPRTQARDVVELAEVYRVVGHHPVDMFPHTRHVENVCLLQRRG